MTTKYKAQQKPYPHDADYHGAKAGLFDPSEDADNLIGKLNAGDTFIYLFRRFGYPRFGWDGGKKLVQYQITTPIPGVILIVEPDVTGGGTFGYSLREDLDQACEDEERKPYMEWYRQCNAWVLEKEGIEIIRHDEPDNDKLQRVWRKWAASHEPNNFADHEEAEVAFYEDQANLYIKYADRYASTHPRPRLPSIENRPDDSIMKQVHTALCDAIMDLMRPIYVRDVMLNIQGEMHDTRNDEVIVEPAERSGYGVGDRLVVI